MKRKTPLNYVRTLRRRWALTQKEVAALLGFESRSVVSRIERGERVPGLESALALEVLFGVAPKAMFPHMYAETEEMVMRLAVPLYEATFQTTSLRQERKRKLLELAMHRATEKTDAKTGV